MVQIDSIIGHLEKLVNWSLKDNKFVEMPEEFHCIDMKPLWEELRSQGYVVLFGPEGSYTFKVVRDEI